MSRTAKHTSQQPLRQTGRRPNTIIPIIMLNTRFIFLKRKENTTMMRFPVENTVEATQMIEEKNFSKIYIYELLLTHQKETYL